MIIAIGLLFICIGASLFLMIGAALMEHGDIFLVPLVLLSLFPIIVGIGMIIS